MTDKEIVRGLEHCFFKHSCKGCSYSNIWDGTSVCLDTLLIDTLDLIKRQQDEIERLDKEIQVTRSYIHDNGLEWDLLSYFKRNGG